MCCSEGGPATEAVTGPLAAESWVLLWRSARGSGDRHEKVPNAQTGVCSETRGNHPGMAASSNDTLQVAGTALRGPSSYDPLEKSLS